MAISFETAGIILGQAIDVLNEAKTAAHQVGDVVDRARENVKMVATLGTMPQIQQLMVQVDNLEAFFHQECIAKISEVQEAIRLAKSG